MPKTYLFLAPPLMNAAGTLGFSPVSRSTVDLSNFGAFVTNPISWWPRTPSRGDRYIPFWGGFLLHTGHPNPGLKKVIRQHAQRWAQSPIPIIVHLLAQDADSLTRMIEHLEGLDGVMGIEIGLPPDVEVGLAYEMVSAAVGELAIIVKVPFERCEIISIELAAIGISAISLSAPRGLLPNAEGQLISGRLNGPSQFPPALSAVRNLAELGIPVIGAGGVYSRADADAMLSAGATAVQLGSVLWRGGVDGCSEENFPE